MNTACSLAVDRRQGVRQLKALGYQRGDKICLTAFYPPSHPKAANDSGRKASSLKSEDLDVWQEEGRGIYFVVNGDSWKKDEIQRGRAIFYEHDNLPKEVSQELWKTLGLPEPTLQVDTGGKSIHSYWRVHCSVEQWVELQTDLLEFADADRSLKNQNRVMRLAGTLHAGTKNLCTIVTESGAVYSYERLREVIPKQELPEILTVKQRPEYSSTDPIPLENCLTLDDRELINNGALKGDKGSNTGRNVKGYKLACNLIATEGYLAVTGYSYQGNARELFDWYCGNCSPPLPSTEGEKIWRSASQSNPTITLTPDAISNCVKAWEFKQGKTSQKTKKSVPTGNSTAKPESEASQSENPFVDPADSDPYEALQLELACLSPELKAEPFKLEFRLIEIARSHKVAVKYVKQLYDYLTDSLGQSSPKTEFTLEEIFELPEEAISWVFPGLLPCNEVVMVAGQPKAGKSLLGVYEAAYAVASGGKFLNVQAKKGRVLIFQLEESIGTIQRRLRRRGFGPLVGAGQVKVVTTGSLLDLPAIEKHIQEFQPTLVIIDSVRNALADSPAPPGSSEYAKPVRRLQRMIMRLGGLIETGLACIVIHHEKKADAFTKGLNRVADTLDLTAAVWGIWQLSRKSEENRSDPERFLDITPREGEGTKYEIEIAPGENSTWYWQFNTESGASWEVQSAEQSILQRLNDMRPKGLTKGEAKLLIENELKQVISDGLFYKCMNRLRERQIVTYRPSETNSEWVYAMPA